MMQRLTFCAMTIAGENVASGRRPLSGTLEVPSAASAGSKNADMALPNRMPPGVLNLEPKYEPRPLVTGGRGSDGGSVTITDPSRVRNC